MNTADVTTKRPAPNHTNVYVGGHLVGRIVRRQGSDSSPRGGAYRNFYYTVGEGAKYTVSHYTRKEAIETILRNHAKRVA